MSVTTAPAEVKHEMPQSAAAGVDCVRVLAEAPHEALKRLARAATRLRSALASGSENDQRHAVQEARVALDSGLSALGGIAVRLARSLRTGSARW